MDKSQYDPLFSEITIGSRKLPNRIIFGSHPTNFARKNRLTDQHTAYYRERARGGAGMIVLEEQLVHPSDLPYEKAPFGFLPENISGYRAIAKAVQPFGTIVVAQLNHSGMQSDGSLPLRELWAPSSVPDVVSREVPKAMEEADIRAVISGFAKTAGHVVEGGLDGVEINAAQFSLIRQFMSPLTNHRPDPYGGDLANRLRFGIEVVQAVRDVIGKDKLLGIRLCGDEFAPWGGLTPEDMAIAARELEKLNLLDYITVAVGSLYSLHLSMATFYSPEGLAVDAAAGIKGAVKLPVFAEGRIHRPDYAAGILAAGKVDGVYMNRALICDPQLPAKLAGGQAGRVRGCISCNQGCQCRSNMGKPLSCLLNPLAGVEAEEENEMAPRGPVKRVLVVGGGPAGMEAAVTAARRGHRVTLWEARPSLGGEMTQNKAFVPEISGVLEAWAAELTSVNVRIATGKHGSAEDILSEAPDVLVLATGCRTVLPEIKVRDCPMKSAREVVSRPAERQKTVLFWDEVGDQVMARAVEKLLAAGNKIYFVTPDLFAGHKLAATMELSSWNPAFMSDLTEIFTLSVVKEVNGSIAVIENKYSGKMRNLAGIETFVYNGWVKPEDELYRALKDRVPEIHRIGDCLAPRGIGAAVREGYGVGRNI